MPDSEPESQRQCPTRPNGAHSLIAHRIEPTTCLERQRRNYHKCFACEYRGRDAQFRLPPTSKPAPPPALESSVTPVRRARSKKAKTTSA